MADALTLLRGYVDSNGPQKEINLEDDDPELTFLTAELLNQRASAHSGSNRLSVGRSTDSTSENPGLLALLHQARQDDIGGSLFQVLSELNSELQLCAGAGERLSYDQYCVLRSRVSKRLRRWLTTKIFLMLHDDVTGGCDIHALYDYFYSIGCMVKTRLTLQSYQDPAAPAGWLAQKDVERWIVDLFPSITLRSDFAQNDPEFLAVYTAAATRCFFFFLDPQKLGRVSVDTLVSSPITDALLEVTLTAEEDALSEAELKELGNNWFSPDCVRRVFEHYSELDTSDVGLVSKASLRLFQGLTLDPPRALTATFLDRLFQEVPTHKRDQDAEKTQYLDFAGFLDLTLAMEFVTSPRALRYLWRCVDVRSQGFLDRFTISFFYRDIVVGLQAEGLEAPALDDVVDEIFDMAKPRVHDRITLADLQKSQTAHTVLSMLIDVNAFWLYENRENLIQYDNDDEEGP